VDFGSFVEGVDGVEIDNAAGAEKAVEFLYKRGHRRIGYLGSNRQTESDEWPNSAARREGYVTALRKLRLEINPAYQRLSWAEPKSSVRVMRDLLALSPAPTAMVCFSEFQAQGALEAARGKKLMRGRGFETVCFSDNPNETPAAGMAGYCVAPWRKIGESAAELVLRRMDNSQAKVTHLVLPPDLIEASSPA
jgi:LacI family transcriptional regulator